jgi:vacuolar-type H+-ATPase subunit I/STV1
MQGDAQRQRLENKIVEYEKRIRDPSEKIPEDQKRMDKSEEYQCGLDDSLESLSERVKSLLELTRNATDLLEYVSRKFLDVREENRMLKGIRTDETEQELLTRRS